MAVDFLNFKVPAGIVTRGDLGRLQKELQNVNEVIEQNFIRQPDATPEMPKTSHLLAELLEINKFNLLSETDRATLIGYLEIIRTKAPILHVSFNTDASPVFQQKLVAWVRQQIHPQVLLQIGLHRNIGAGCVVRTTNRNYDFSLRERFKDQKQLLITKMHSTMSNNKSGVSL